MEQQISIYTHHGRLDGEKLELLESYLRLPHWKNFFVKSLNYSTTKGMHHKGSDCIVLYVGVNDLPDTKNVHIAQGVIERYKKSTRYQGMESTNLK